MTLLLPSFLVAIGIALLFFGGEVLVDNSIRLARHFKLSTMVIGLTVVAFGTSCPELAATLTAALRGSPDIAVGNVLGSNVANLGLILGASALVMPLSASVAFLRREMAFMIFVTVAAWPILWGGMVSRIEGLVLVVLLLGFLYYLLHDPGAQDEHQVPVEELARPPRPVGLATLGVLAGVALLVGGAQSLIAGATEIALAFGVPERVIGFTLVALGTSLPELAASLVAAKKGEGDLVIGNLIGSNVFNLLLILGLTAIVVPIPVAPAALALDFWAVLGISILTLIFLAVGRELTRLEGGLLLASYVGYCTFLYLQ